jgi:hypothetical protein
MAEIKGAAEEVVGPCCSRLPYDLFRERSFRGRQLRCQWPGNFRLAGLAEVLPYSWDLE